MNSRERILAAVKQNQPALAELHIYEQPAGNDDLQAKFTAVLESIGGKVIVAKDLADVKAQLPSEGRIVSTIPGLQFEMAAESDPHRFGNVELAILPAHFAVAENGAVWVTEELLQQRALPFITQHLAIVVNKEHIVPTMHDAYKRIGDEAYGFGTFIAGPSKTADIEQSLVLGAHGSRSMTVFLL